MSDERSDDPAGPGELAEVDDWLRRERRQPPPAFRGSLRSALAGRAPRPRPEGLRLLIARYAVVGAVLLAVGALGAAGAGPFGF